MSKKQIRNINLQLSGLHVREAEGEEKSREIEGRAVVYGVRSVNLVPWSSYREVYEVIEPGAITQDLINRSDVVLTAFHDNTKILGRSVNGKGTLTLGLDAKGMSCRCTLGNTTDANDVLEMISRGDVTGMSFCFTAPEDDSENGVSYEKLDERSADGKKEVWIRHVKQIDGLYDVTVAGHPAYKDTSVEQREEGNAIESTIEAQVRESDDAQKQKEERELEEQALRHYQERQLMLMMMSNN